MRFALPFAVLAGLTLSACGGNSSQGVVGNSNVVIVFEVADSNPLVMYVFHSGETLAFASDPCSPAKTQWCTRTDSANKREISFELDRDKAPYVIYIGNPSSSDQTGIVKIYVDGILRFNKSKTVLASSVLNATEIS